MPDAYKGPSTLTSGEETTMRQEKSVLRAVTKITGIRMRKWWQPLRHFAFFCCAAVALAIPVICSAESMHNDITAFQGAKTCAECHDTSAQEVMESLHYQMRGEPKFIDGWDKGKPAGMMVDFSPLYHTMAPLGWVNRVRQAGAEKQGFIDGCAKCHAGLGAPPQQGTISESDLSNIDCLICHAPDYRRVLVKKTTSAAATSKGKKEQREEAGFRMEPAPGVDTLKAARQAKKPSTGMCLRCHGTNDGAYGAYGRPGIVDGEGDVHFPMGITCTECHTVKKHKIAGGADLRAQELTETQVGCPNCHTEKPHKGKESAQLNRHCYRIACQSCHIPAIARNTNESVMTEIDWSAPKRNVTSGLFEPTIRRATRLKPEYAWWNRMMSPAGEPLGSKRDRKARIYPWQRVVCTVINDAATGRPLPLHPGIYAATGDIEAALRKGAAETQQAYSGKWKTAQQTVLLSVNHQVAPKTEALKCDDCHGEHARVDLKTLGYGMGRR